MSLGQLNHSTVTLFAKFLVGRRHNRADGDVVGEQLQGDNLEDGEQELGGLGMM
jgi:hypothetical protein